MKTKRLKKAKVGDVLWISRYRLRKAMEQDFYQFMVSSMSVRVGQPFPTRNVEAFIFRVLKKVGLRKI